MTRSSLALATLIWALTPARADAACTIDSSGVVFGSYDVFSVAPTTTTGAVVYNCDAFEKDVRISLGPGHSGTYVARTLVGGSESLVYNLYLDAALTRVWGDNSGGTSSYFRKNPPPRRDVTVTIYGAIPAGQDVSTGGYADTLIVTIDF